MTNYEAFFGTPERAAKTMDEVVLDGQDFCFMMDALSMDRDVKCRNCINENDRYGCERKPVTYLEWLMQEVDE